MAYSSLPEHIRQVAERELTRRQLDVFRMRMNGASMSNIAVTLDISESVAYRTYQRAAQKVAIALRREETAA